MMQRHRLSTKFIAITLAITALVMLGLIVAVVTSLRDQIEQDVANTRFALLSERAEKAKILHQNLESKGAGLAGFVAKLAPNAMKAFDFARLEAYASQVRRDEEVLYAAVFDTDGKLLTLQDPPASGRDVLLVERACIDEYGTTYGVVRIGLSKAALSEALERSDASISMAIAGAEAEGRRSVARLIRSVVTIFMAGGLLLFVVLWLAFSRMVVMPVGQVAATLREIARGDFSQRVSLQTGDEMGELASSFNQMAADLQATTVSRDELAREVVERKKANERFRNLIEGSPFGILVVDTQKRICEANRAALRMIGRRREEVEGEVCHNFICPACQGECPVLDLGQQVDNSERVVVRLDGTEVPVLKSVAKVELAGETFLIEAFTDISERKRAEAERLRLEGRIQHAQKLESLGVLAGGIAHDFNNILMVILGNVDLAKDELSDASTARPFLDAVRSGAVRAAELSNQMLAYSGKGRFVVRPIDLNELVMEMSHLLNAGISKKAMLKHELDESLPTVEADVSQLRQVVMNLITNASDALGQNTGTIAIRTGTIEVEKDEHRDSYIVPLDQASAAKQRLVCLEVSDTGCGMDEETRGKIFDPFFTTKFTGRGLGLAAVLGIVQGHRGTISVHSTPGQGTAIRVLLPPADAPVLPPPGPVQRPGKGAGWSGRATVLLVDDEKSLRTIAKFSLPKWGFTVLTACDGREGVDMLEEHLSDIDIVVLDLTMPRMNGEEALREMRKIRADMPVVLCSGFDQQETMAQVASWGVSACMQKPFSMVALADQLKTVLSVQSGTTDAEEEI